MEVIEITTEQGNRFIAEFMGGKWYAPWECERYGHNKPIFFFETPQEYARESAQHSYHYVIEEPKVLFHTSWSWLMEVVEKIESLEFGVEIIKSGCYISSWNNDETFKKISVDGDSKIQAAWYACIEFIQWFNNNK